MSDGRDAWRRYWAAGGNRPRAGCLPDRSGPLEATWRGVWQGLARRMARGAHVLDLGTGAGDVLVTMSEARRDLRLVGIDLAPAPPTPRKGIVLKGSIDMAKMSFSAARFDAIASQFGYEYGDTAATAREAARVAKPGAALLFCIHHASSRIVSHNRSRARSLLWAVRGDGPLQQAKAFAASGLPLRLATPPALLAAPGEARRLFPDQGAAAEVMTGMIQRLEVGHRAPTEARRLLDDLEAEVRGEVERLRLLGEAARDEEQIEGVADELRGAGFGAVETTVLDDPLSGGPLAWLVKGSR